MTSPPHPHDEHLRGSWKVARWGLRRAAEDLEGGRRVLAWIERMKPRFEGSPYLAIWERLLAGREPELARELLGTADFFELPPARRGFWRAVVQSHPFASIIPGRSTRERRAVLPHLP